MELSESGNPGELARKLNSWSPVIAARRAIVSIRALLPGLPGNHPLWWAVDRITADAHEITELDLVDKLRNGETRLLRDVNTEATRLLGADGADPHSRLGLELEADGEQVRAAAQRAAQRWRHVSLPLTGAGVRRCATFSDGEPGAVVGHHELQSLCLVPQKP